MDFFAVPEIELLICASTKIAYICNYYKSNYDKCNNFQSNRFVCSLFVVVFRN